MGESNAASAARPSSCRRGPGGCGLALGRLVRRLRRRSKMLCTAARPAAASRYCHQYDPLSYARNFDRDGFGTGLDDGDDVSGHLYNHYTFAARFVLASSSDARQPQ